MVADRGIPKRAPYTRYPKLVGRYPKLVGQYPNLVGRYPNTVVSTRTLSVYPRTPSGSTRTLVAWKDTPRWAPGRVRVGSGAGPGRVRAGSGAGPERVRGGSGPGPWRIRKTTSVYLSAIGLTHDCALRCYIMIV